MTDKKFTASPPPTVSFDYYQTYRPGRPKEDIADYVETMGIRVPPRFESLDRALASGQPFIQRSEHPQDYDGVSGLLESKKYGLNQDKGILISTPLDIFEDACRKAAALSQNVRDYCRLTSVDVNDFIKDVSYSYWELLGGTNRSVIADSAIPDRYHVFSTKPPVGKWLKSYNYTVIDNGSVTISLPGDQADEFPIDPGRIVGFYESVRRLPRFDPNHDPVIEMQSVEDIDYFLQYMRTQDHSPATFSLDRTKTGDGSEAVFVRGATPPEGVTYQTSFWYRERRVLRYEDAGYDMPALGVFPDLMARRRKAVLISARGGILNVAKEGTIGHQGKSRLFKPPLSVVLQSSDIDRILKDMKDQINKPDFPNYPYTIPLHFVSDGRRAFVRRIQESI